MFGRRPTPRLSIAHRLEAIGAGSLGTLTHCQGLLVLSISNTGRGPARAPYLAVRLMSQHYLEINPERSGPQDGLTRRQKTDRGRIVFTSRDVVIHSDVSHDVTAVPITAPHKHGESVYLPGDLVLEYELAAEHARLVRGTLRISGPKIARALLPSPLNAHVRDRASSG